MKLYKVKVRRFAYREEVVAANSPDEAVKWIESNESNQDFQDSGYWDCEPPSAQFGEVIGVIQTEADLPDGWKTEHIPWGINSCLDVEVSDCLSVGIEFTEEEVEAKFMEKNDSSEAL